MDAACKGWEGEGLVGARHGARQGKASGRKRFFFEKKNQKTFTNRSTLYPETPKQEKPEFFCGLASSAANFCQVKPTAAADKLCPIRKRLLVPLFIRTRSLLRSNHQALRLHLAAAVLCSNQVLNAPQIPLAERHRRLDPDVGHVA